MIQRISGKGFHGNRDTTIVHKQPHLKDWKLSLLFAYTHFPHPFFQYRAVFVKDILIRIFDLEIEIGNIVINDLRTAMRLFYKICIDASYDLILVFIKKGQGVINIIRIETL